MIHHCVGRHAILLFPQTSQRVPSICSSRQQDTVLLATKCSNSTLRRYESGSHQTPINMTASEASQFQFADDPGFDIASPSILLPSRRVGHPQRCQGVYLCLRTIAELPKAEESLGGQRSQSSQSIDTSVDGQQLEIPMRGEEARHSRFLCRASQNCCWKWWAQQLDCP